MRASQFPKKWQTATACFDAQKNNNIEHANCSGERSSRSWKASLTVDPYMRLDEWRDMIGGVGKRSSVRQTEE
jgi:hypothetical protein